MIDSEFIKKQIQEFLLDKTKLGFEVVEYNVGDELINYLFGSIGGLFFIITTIYFFLKVTRLGKKNFVVKRNGNAVRHAKYTGREKKGEYSFDEMYAAFKNDQDMLENANLEIKTTGGFLGDIYNNIRDIGTWPPWLKKLLLKTFGTILIIAAIIALTILPLYLMQIGIGR